MQQSVRLSPEPQSASAARAWIREQLTVMGHPELVDSAQLATSELVTNAVLHARTRITLAVSDDDDEILIEVADTSNLRLLRSAADNPPEGGLTTVGNGLHIIGALARRWGVRERGGEGKTVWFVPATPEELSQAGPRFPPDMLDVVVLEDTDTVDVVLLDTPVRLLWESRFRVRDLRREMALLTVMRQPPAGVPGRMVEVAEEIDQINTSVLLSDGDFEGAFARQDESVTLHYVVPRRVGPACGQLAGLLEEADAFCADAHLLTLAAPPEERRLRRWFLCEFARQAAGLCPHSVGLAAGRRTLLTHP